jgi:2-polyprenyl-6-hydroxyphenyl methylase/3-demethylubiquinone-9 3-methyltransferase
LARLGHDVLGVDAGDEVIAAARAHADGLGLPLSYRVATAEALRVEGERFGAITALEVIEHVADQPAFVADLAGLLVPGGVLVLSTLNRTRRSYAVAKVGAEFVLRLLPAGTHDWKRFVAPAELGAMLRAAGLLVTDVAGMVFDPLAGRWRESRDTAINYIMMARKS